MACRGALVGGSSAKRGAFSSLPCKGAGKGSRARRTATTSPRHSLPWLVCPDFSGVSLGRGSHCSKVLSDYNFPTFGGILPHFNVNTSLWTWAFAHRPIRRLLPGIVCTQTCKCTSPRRRITCIGKLQRTDKERLKTRTAMYDLGPSGSRVSSRRARGAV